MQLGEHNVGVSQVKFVSSCDSWDAQFTDATELIIRVLSFNYEGRPVVCVKHFSDKAKVYLLCMPLLRQEETRR